VHVCLNQPIAILKLSFNDVLFINYLEHAEGYLGRQFNINQSFNYSPWIQNDFINLLDYVSGDY